MTPSTEFINHATCTTDAERLDSMVEAGPLYILSGHLLDSMGGGWLPAPFNGRIHLPYHLIDGARDPPSIQAFRFSAPAMALGQGWFIGTPMLSQLIA